MKLSFKHTLLMATGIMALSGCIRDEIGPCPNLSVVLEIKDRYYSNAAEVGYPTSGASSGFSDVVPTLHYVLRDFNTGEVVRSLPVTELSNDGENHTLQFDEELPFGKYVLTSWGALVDDGRLSADSEMLDLTDLDTDVFVQNMVVDYQYNSAEHKGALERVNGMVIVDTKWETFPPGINKSEMVFTNLDAQVNNKLEYSNNQDIKVYYNISNSSETQSITVLPPSVSEDGTVLKIRFYDSERPDEIGIVTDDVMITVRRNEITRHEFSFDPYSKSVTVKTMVNGRWQQVHDMGVD